jgi:hypothetical protein
MRRAHRLAFVLAAGLLGQAGMQAQPSPILQAMQDEMKRAMEGLRLANEPAPYYIAYVIEDVESSRIATKLGSIVSDGSFKSRMLRVDVRVGDYRFDSSRFRMLDRDPGMLASYGSYGLSAPLDDDDSVMRRQIWLATDGAYKRAVQMLSRKKATAQSRTVDSDEPPDFSRETPTQRVMPAAAPATPARGWLEDLRKASAVFASFPDIHNSDVTLQQSHGMRYFVTSEGSKVVEPTGQASISISASTQADDGMPLRDAYSAVGRNLADLGAPGDMVARASDVARRLLAARSAPVGEDFTGPVLIEGQAAPALFAQTFVPNFLSLRAAEADGMLAGISRPGASTFLTRIGSRVMPEPFSVKDTPSLQTLGQTSVPGSYAVDEEGVPAKDVTLVQDGKLLTLLTSRTPQKGLLQSNGHGRYAGAMPGVFQLESSRAVPVGELKAKYLQMLKEQNRPYGYIVRAVANVSDLIMGGVDEDLISLISGMMPGSGGTTAGVLVMQAVKVLADGTERPVRGVNIANVQPTVFRSILEASRERTLYNYRGTPTGVSGATPMSASPPLVSVIAPDVIFEELEIQRNRDTRQKPPAVPPPGRK